MAASKEALIVKDSTWAVAKKLYVDASGSDKATEEWKALPPATKARFFMSAQSLVVGRHGPRELTGGLDRPDVEKAVHSLQKSVHDLAFDLFSDEKFKWAENQVASRSGKSSHSPTSTSGSYPDIQHLLATTYRNISESNRQIYVRRAETLLSTSFFVSPQPESSRNVDDALKASTTLSVPLHRTMITFTIQFLGLAESDTDRKTRGIVDQAVDDMIRVHLRRQYVFFSLSLFTRINSIVYNLLTPTHSHKQQVQTRSTGRRRLRDHHTGVQKTLHHVSRQRICKVDQRFHADCSCRCTTG